MSTANSKNWCVLFFRDPEGKFTVKILSEILLDGRFNLAGSELPLRVNQQGPEFSISIVRGSDLDVIRRSLPPSGCFKSLQTCDAGLKVDVGDLEETLDEINTLISVQTTLQDATQGLWYRAWNDRYSSPSAESRTRPSTRWVVVPDPAIAARLVAKEAAKKAEEHWATCSWRGLFRRLGDRLSERKFRLFACACCRLIWNQSPDEVRAGVEVAEAFADGAVKDRVRAKSFSAVKALHTLVADPARQALEKSVTKYELLVGANVVVVLAKEAARKNGWPESYWIDFEEGPERLRADLLREIFRDPEQKAVFNNAWLTPGVTELAKQIYEERSFDQLPKLAGKLSAAGCDDRGLLEHLRSKTSHVRGCWALDLVLGKE